MHPTFNAYQHIYRQGRKNHIAQWFGVILLLAGITLFLPWTQTIRAKGTVTALRQEGRPQQVNTIIAGRVEKWFVKEGDFVQKGDTLIQLSETKPDYLDPQLLQRTAEQVEAKKAALNYYQNKAAATGSQIGALQNSLRAKFEQLEGKLRQLQVKAQADSMDMLAATSEWKIASMQYDRQKAMHDSGLVSLTQLEGRVQAYQNATAKKISAENKFLATRQEMQITQIEFRAVQQDYREKVLKAEGDRFGSLSQAAGSEGELAKLQNQYASYAVRNGMYYILAPQSGQVVRTRTSGIGEIVKEGELLLSIVPKVIDYAVELYVRPVDLPLVCEGQTVRFLFDGFPAIVFSGWPEASYGTYEGIVSAVESNVGENGKFKVLVRENPGYRSWPRQLMMGTGASGIALLKNVPVWYELWRNINSFPPDYYHTPKKGGDK